MEKRLKLGVSGAKGSFSEEAARHYASKEGLSDPEIVYLISASNVLKAVDEGSVDKGVFPIENSNGGIVYEAVYAMSRFVFNIEDMFEIDIKHCLLGKKGVNTGDIEVIVSHQQALKQCNMYLKRKWGDIEIKEYSDTAEAAKDLSKEGLPERAAVIAPRICADFYDLDVLEEGIQDLKFNFTTFIVAVK